MNTQHYEYRPQWRSYLSYVLVTTGAIVGLGNVFQFPYFIIHYGGLFLLLYLLCELVISVPLLFSELLIGRRGKQNPVGSLTLLSYEADASYKWRYFGWLSVLIAFLTLSYYMVQAAYPVSYLMDSVHAFFAYGPTNTQPVAVDNSLLLNFCSLELCVVFFLLATFIVVARGIHRGLEAISLIIVPAYMIILAVLALYLLKHGQSINALANLFSIRDTQSVLTVLAAAMGFAFFKLNVGAGTMIVYGSYLPYTVPLARSTLWVILLDAIVSLLSYFVIYPLMVASNSGLTTEINNLTVHYIFNGIPGGVVIAIFFFLAGIMAAWTATIALAETVTVTLLERFDLRRLKAAALACFGALVVATAIVFMHTHLFADTLFGKWPLPMFIQTMTSEWLTPISAIAIAVFVGWIVKRKVTQAELRFKPIFYQFWRWDVRILVPIVILIIVLRLWLT